MFEVRPVSTRGAGFLFEDNLRRRRQHRYDSVGEALKICVLARQFAQEEGLTLFDYAIQKVGGEVVVWVIEGQLVEPVSA